MAVSHRKLLLSALAGALATGYVVYSAFADQGHGALAQQPLNNMVHVPPAFVMAVDDSGSMTFQTQFPGRDGGALWDRDSSSEPYSFFHTSGTNKGKLRASTTSRQFVHVAPYPAPRQSNPGNDNAAIPPVDTFGFSRSHVYNPAYFNPFIEYEPWVDADGNPWPEADPDDTRVDPRNASPTVDLTEQRRSSSSNNSTHHAFRVRYGMWIPEGTEFYDTGTARDCGFTRQRSNGIGGTNGDWRELQEGIFVSCSAANIYLGYYPATFYLPEDMDAPPGYKTSERVLAENACAHHSATGADSCNLWRYEIKRDHYESTAAYNAAIQNFANWFSFYGNRNRAMIAAMTRSMSTVTSMRVGMFQINSYGSFDEPMSKASERVAMRDVGIATERALLYDSMTALTAGGQTPNRHAVRAGALQFRRTDDNAPVQLSCQRNGLMLFTDGYTNNNGPSVGNLDEELGVPFSDDHSNTMADIVTEFYIDDDDGDSPIRPDLPAGNVPVPEQCPTDDPRVNCQANLHVNFYGVTLGGRGDLFDPDRDDQDPYADSSIHGNWPSRENDRRSTVDDIWHATINTRGRFINARSPAEITEAMRQVLAAVEPADSPSGSIAMTGARVGVGSMTVQPFYEIKNQGTDWFSYLRAFTVAKDPDVLGGVREVEAWEASQRIPSHSARKIWFGRGNNVLTFDDSNITGDQLCDSSANGMSRCKPFSSSFGPGKINITASEAVRYLRGDTSLEVRNGGKLRDRTTRLGDIVNSTPVVSGPLDDYGYRSLSHETWADSYGDFLAAKRANRKSMVYVGANDGMLHAFHGGMGADGVLDSSVMGREQFAYIPESVVGHLGNLLFPYVPDSEGDQRFQHRYYVDGPVVVGDAYYGSSWKTVLVGTTGAGGRGVFALDVSDASSATPFTSSSRLWEINSINSSLPEAVRQRIGHVLGRPVIVPFKTTGGDVSFKAIFGNGYNSVSGKAVLFVVDLASGAPKIRMIEATEEDGPGTPNGLGNIVVLDRWGGADLKSAVRDGFADTVYAADQNGAIWKFDLRSDLPAEGGIGLVDAPLFVTQSTAGDDGGRQPILGGLAAAAGPGGGVMLYFGTGSFSFVGDTSDESVQSLYGVLDDDSGTTRTHASLLQQTVSAPAVAGGPRAVSTLHPGAAHKGWYVDLPAGERMVGYPRVENGVVFMPTYSPNEADGCSTSGYNSLFGLGALSGAAALWNVRVGSPTGDSPPAETGAIPLNTGGTAPVKDVAVMTTPRLAPLGPGATPAELADALAGQCSMVVQVAGAPPLYLPRACGRQSWRQVQ